MEVFIIAFLSYLSGSIPFGLIITKIFSGKDIRNIGSGNIGATNVLRTGNKYLAIATLLLDLLKGYIPVFVTYKYFPELVPFACLLTFLGHTFPLWLKFKGGKGVATYLGILFAISPEMGLLFIFVWLVVSLIFKYSSVSSMFASLTVFIVFTLRELAENSFSKIGDLNYNSDKFSFNISFLLFIFFILIIFNHRKNIYNLKNNKEPKIKI